ncbi:EndoU domain-containing protein, partial [Nocardia sp. NPDC058497]|uniref:EndoU domain-containing protein n=1 Tax=Nocardia sp. NPDC058497 TaxID=3346529 RepID=UPI003662743A
PGTGQGDPYTHFDENGEWDERRPWSDPVPYQSEHTLPDPSLPPVPQSPQDGPRQSESPTPQSPAAPSDPGTESRNEPAPPDPVAPQAPSETTHSQSESPQTPSENTPESPDDTQPPTPEQSRPDQTQPEHAQPIPQPELPPTLPSPNDPTPRPEQQDDKPSEHRRPGLWPRLVDRLGGWLVSEPSFLESLIPVYGPLRGLIADVNKGNTVGAVVNLGFLALDLTGVGALARIGGKLALHAGEVGIGAAAAAIFGSKGVREAAEQAVKLKSDPATWVHVFKGEFNRAGNPTGYHHRPNGRDRFGVTVTDKSVPDKNGVYTGTVTMNTWNGNEWVTKKVESSFFPDSWSQEQVQHAISRASSQPYMMNPSRRRWEGVFRGMAIGGYYDPSTGRIITAFPIP